MALDDPEGWSVYDRIMSESGDDSLVHVFTNLTGVGNVEVNAFQRLSDVIVQKSLREGFGLVVSEAMWKGTPVVAGRVGGIPLQMADGAGGLLVDTVEEAGAAITRLLGDSGQAEFAGRAGQERVREHFLLPRLLLDEVTLLRHLAANRPAEVAGRDETSLRDPVCGMSVLAAMAATSVDHVGHTYRFCSLECGMRFEADPDHFLANAHE